MKSLIVNMMAGTGLFAGALVGTLAATGRLNHDGVANIPLLNTLFPAPAAVDAVPNAAAAGGAGRAEPKDAQADGGGAAREAGHPAPVGESSAGSADAPPHALKRGHSVLHPDEKTEEHGAEPKGEQGGKEKGQGPAKPAANERPAHAAEQDFTQLGSELAQDRKNRYAPGGYFRFDGMPAGMTAEQINAAWQRVQEAMADLERRQKAFELREGELRLLADDIARRQTELGKERTAVENLQRQLDERIERFKEQVKLVRTDEVAGLKRNAQTLASFEPSKAAELIQEQWKVEAGQEEVLKMLEFMDKDAINAVLAAMPNAMVRDVLQKRLRVVKEAVPAPAAGR